MARRRTDPPEPLDRGELRAALLDLLRLAALWESGALARGRAETRAADERLLRDVVRASQEHQSGEKSVPVARVGKHLVRRVDLQLARVHERVAGVLRELDGPIDAEVLDPRRAAFASGGLKGVTRETLARPPKSSLSAPPTGQTLQVPSGQAWKVYYYAGSQRIAVRVLTSSSDTLYYLHADHLGSTSLTTDNSGNRVGELKYYPFGETRYTWGSTPTDRRFTGQQEESALGSLYEFNARYYSPALGRFLSADTIVPGAGNPQAFNRYAYSLSNPVKYVDPTGHFSEDEIQKFFGKESWEDVLKLFQEGGELEGRWGWLAVLQKAEYGDSIEIEWDTSLLPNNHPPVDDVFVGKFTKGPEGGAEDELLILGKDLFLDQMKAARYGKQYELFVEGRPQNMGKLVTGAVIVVTVDLTLGPLEVLALWKSAGNPLVVDALELLNQTVVFPLNALGIALMVDGAGRAPETKLNVPAKLDPRAVMPHQQ